jgi:hypothetical protein
MSDWKLKLTHLFSDEYRDRFKKKQEERKGKLRVKQFIADVVEPAFEEVAGTLNEFDRDVEIETSRNSAVLKVTHKGKEEFYFGIKVRPYEERKFMFPVLPIRDEAGQLYRAVIYLKGEKERMVEHDVTNYTREDIAETFVYYYRRHFEWNH